MREWDRWRRVVTALVATCVALPAIGHAAKRYSADRFDVSLQAMADGSVRVSETVVFRFEGGPFTYVFRDLPTSRTDGVSIERVTIDGRDVSSAAEIVQDRSHVRVRWRFPPLSDATATFGVEYVAHRAVEPLPGDEALLAWRVLPSRHDYRIASSRMAVQIPPGFGFAGAPEIRPRGAAFIADAAPQGGDLNRETRLELRASNIRKDGTVVIRQRLTSATAQVLMPAWLEHDRRVAREAPFWLMAAAILGVMELSGVLVLWRGRRSALDLPVYPTPVPLDETPPALAGALVTDGASPSRLHAIATLFSLAQRGAITIEERPRSSYLTGLTPRQFSVRATSAAADIRPHERVVLDLVTASPDQSLSRVVRRLQRHFGAFKAALEQEMRDAGWTDPARRGQKRGLAVVSGVLLAAAGASFVVVLQFVGADGPALLAIPASSVVAVSGFVMSAIYTPLSDTGLEASARWKRFRVHLQDVSKGRASIGGASARETFEPYFPYVIAFGLAESWTKHFRNVEPDLPVPAWFHAAQLEDDGAAFAAMVAGSGGASSAAAGGAAGGGGASGAG